MADKFDEMNKGQLRSACKDAGISYGGLNNDGMRDALRAKEAAPAADGFEATAEELAKQTSRKPAEDAVEPAPEVAPAAPAKPKPKRQPKPAKQGDRHTGEGLKIEKDREEKNGVKRPSAGGKCREIWDYLDEVYDDGKGPMPTAKMVKEASEQCEWNANNASIEFYQWRKFMGIKGRVAAAKK